MNPLSAQLARGWSLAELLVVVVVVCAAAAVVWIAVKAFGIPVPPWAAQIVGVIIVACVAVLAIKFLFSL